MAVIFGSDFTRSQVESFTGELAQIAGIEKFEFEDGRARGLRGVRVRSGSGLDFTMLAGRNLDIAHASFAEVPLCWRSRNGDAAPEYYDPQDDGWLQTFFGGLMTTCGLTNFGPASDDVYGKVGLHGRVNCLPVEDVRCHTDWEGDECKFEVSGTTRETRVFGEDLSLYRRVWTFLGSHVLNVEDVVTNHGGVICPHMILYHCNAGFPLLGPDSELHVSHRSMRPRDAEAEKGMDVWNMGDKPTAGFKEQVFLHEPIACRDGLACALMVNRALLNGAGLGLAVRFDVATLPAFQQWRMLGSGTYVMGMEPANCPDEGRSNAIRKGTLPFLEPGESRTYRLQFEVLTGAEAIDEAILAIEEANGRPITPGDVAL